MKKHDWNEDHTHCCTHDYTHIQIHIHFVCNSKFVIIFIFIKWSGSMSIYIYSLSSNSHSLNHIHIHKNIPYSSILIFTMVTYIRTYTTHIYKPCRFSSWTYEFTCYVESVFAMPMYLHNEGRVVQLTRGLIEWCSLMPLHSSWTLAFIIHAKFLINKCAVQNVDTFT